MLTIKEQGSKIKQFLNATGLDPEVTESTLGIKEDHISARLLLESSKQLIKLNKQEIEPSDRDNLKYSKFLGFEDYVTEHINRDAARIQQKAAYKMQTKKNLSWLTPGFFTPQIRSIVISNALANNVDGINPLEHWDNSHRVTKLGPGGIQSTDAIPSESREVNPSSFGFFDPVHIMESEKVGVTNFIAHNVGKGRDQKLYRLMKTRDGLKWLDHEKILNSQAVIPEN